jgi:hypothetical protein
MTYQATKLAILEAIQADLRVRLYQIVHRLEVDVHTVDEPSQMERALRTAVASLSDALAEGIHAQVREAGHLDQGRRRT